MPLDIPQILRDNYDREKKIKELKDDEPQKYRHEIADLLNRIRNDYRQVIISKEYFLMEDKKDIDGSLWKFCFYKQIEEFRRSIRNYAGQIENSKQFPNNSATSLPIDKLKAYLGKLTASFIQFLADSIIFYQTLMLEFEDSARLLTINRNSTEIEDKNNDKIHDSIIHCVHRCLLYLGDLARYKELYSDNDSKEFIEAERYYERASLIVPTFGNAQNQLAVLATYNEAECIAVYHYCRSNLVEHPFTGGLENLSVLFAKNAKLFSQLNAQKSMISDHSSRNKSNGSNDFNKTKLFLTKFIKLHGVLFAWSQQSIQKTDNNDNNNNSDNIFAPDLSPYWSLLQIVFEEYDQQLANFSLPDALLVRLLSICLFSVYHCSNRRFPSQKTSTRTLTECLAIITLFGLINRSCVRINLAMSSGEKGRKSLMNRLLPMLSVFSDWSILHKEYLVSTEFLDYLHNQSVNGTNVDENEDIHMLQLGSQIKIKPNNNNTKHSFADKELLRAESRSRSGMRASLSSLIEILEEDKSKNEFVKYDFANETSVEFLREYVELRGFLPVAERFEKNFNKFDPLSKNLNIYSETKSRFLRQVNIIQFISNILVPLAAKELSVIDSKRQMLKEQEQSLINTPKANRISPFVLSITSTDNNNNNNSSRKGTSNLKSEEKKGILFTATSTKPQTNTNKNQSNQFHSKNQSQKKPSRNETDTKHARTNSEGNALFDHKANNQASPVVGKGLSGSNNHVGISEEEFPPLPGTNTTKQQSHVNAMIENYGKNIINANYNSENALNTSTSNQEVVTSDNVMMHWGGINVDPEYHDDSQRLSYNNHDHNNGVIGRDLTSLSSIMGNNSVNNLNQKSALINANTANGDDELLDDVIVFRPAFARILNQTPTPPHNNSNYGYLPSSQQGIMGGLGGFGNDTIAQANNNPLGGDILGYLGMKSSTSANSLNNHDNSNNNNNNMWISTTSSPLLPPSLPITTTPLANDNNLSGLFRASSFNDYWTSMNTTNTTTNNNSNNNSNNNINSFFDDESALLGSVLNEVNSNYDQLSNNNSNNYNNNQMQFGLDYDYVKPPVSSFASYLSDPKNHNLNNINNNNINNNNNNNNNNNQIPLQTNHMNYFNSNSLPPPPPGFSNSTIHHNTQLHASTLPPPGLLPASPYLTSNRTSFNSMIGLDNNNNNNHNNNNNNKTFLGNNLMENDSSITVSLNKPWTSNPFYPNNG
eukprot:gene8246-11160_t